jgi:hypothetical protein
MDGTDLYLSLLKGCLTRSLFIDEQRYEIHLRGWRARVWEVFNHSFHKDQNWRIFDQAPVNAELRAAGRDWPQNWVVGQFESRRSYDAIRTQCAVATNGSGSGVTIVLSSITPSSNAVENIPFWCAIT